MEYVDYQTEKTLFNPTVVVFFYLFNVDLKQSDTVNEKSPD